MSSVESTPEGLDDDEFNPEVLTGYEAWWRDQQPWLKERGYMLRPRFRPDWIPSWRGKRKHWYECEDGIMYPWGSLLDAIRSSDGKLVGLKKVDTTLHPFEADINRLLSSEPLASDPNNRCASVYEILRVPSEADTILLVMPYLREYDSPRFETFGEAMEFFRQALTGLQFMHKHGIAHRDCHSRNIMYDATPLYPEGYHPDPDFHDRKPDFTGRARHYTRTQSTPKYYWIDFGLSRQYDLNSSNPPSELRIWGGDKSVPEFQEDEPYNPFPTDVYCVGNLIRMYFLDAKKGFSFMQPLISDMVQDDPSKRPTMNEVVTRFDEIRRSLSQWKLRSRVVHKKDSYIFGIYRASIHIVRSIQYLIARIPAVPVP